MAIKTNKTYRGIKTRKSREHQHFPTLNLCIQENSWSLSSIKSTTSEDLISFPFMFLIGAPPKEKQEVKT